MWNAFREEAIDATRAAGGRIVRSDYARTLAAIAEQGPDYLYHGPLGKAITDDMAANGVNVLCQAIAVRVEADGTKRYSLSCNPDLTEDLLALRRQVQQVHAAEPLLNYLQDLIAATRSGRWFIQGLSPRAALAVVRSAKAQAYLSGRDYVAPDDIAAVLPQTVAHRLTPVRDAGRGPVEQVRAMLDAVPLP